MLAKLTALITSKVALAAIGGTLVVGGGVTVAAAETGHLPDNVPVLGPISAQHHDSQNKGNQGDQGNHGHTIAIEGTIKSFDGTSLVVTGKADDQGDANDSNDDSGNKSSTPTAGGSTTATAHDGTSDGHDEGTPTATHTPSSSNGDSGDSNGDSKSQSSPKCTFANGIPAITVNSSTKINGQAKTLDDLKADAGHSVQVQATASTDCTTLTAWKVTVGGKPGGDDNGGDNGNNGVQQGHVVTGTVGTVGATSFVLQPTSGSPLTVNVSTTTKFSGVSGLANLKSGMHATVVGTEPSANTINAAAVMVEGSDGHGNGDGHGTPTPGAHD
jgi:hypothetical protein